MRSNMYHSAESIQPKPKKWVSPARSVCLAIVAAMCVLNTTAQSSLIQYLPEGYTELSEQQSHYLRAWTEDETVAGYQLAAVNTAEVNQRTLQFEVFGETFTLEKHHIDTRGPGQYSWTGFTADFSGTAIFVVNDQMLTGIFTLDNSRYMLVPLGEGIHAMLDINQSAFPIDEREEDYAELLKTAGEPRLDYIDTDKGVGYEPSKSNNDCSMRYLIAYTGAVSSALIDVHSFIQGCVDDHNAVNLLSNGQHTVHLARSVLVTYTESGDHALDRDRFHSTSDNFMDEIHDLRNLYDADVCQLIVNTGSGCGIAKAIGANYASAFAVTKRSCAIGNHTFTHETGHLYGCRHDTYVDNSNTPYAYGHGFVRSTGTQSSSWRTVMAYNNKCESDGYSCVRLGRWSNPSLTHLGFATGTTASADNARVVRERNATMAGFEAKINNKSVYENDVVLNNEQGHFEGTTSVTAPGAGANALTYNSGSRGSIRANNSVTLTEGFWARSGTVFTAFLGDCNPAPAADQMYMALANDEEVHSDEIEDAAQNYSPDQALSVSIFPNPFRQTTFVEFENKGTEAVRVTLYDMMGKPIIQAVEGVGLPQGINRIELNTAQLPSGIYVVAVESNGERVVQRVVKSR